MENKSHAFWAGLFTIGLACAIVAMLFWFNRDQAERLPYDVISTTNVTGLTVDAAVRYRGLDVGRVDSIAFDQQHPGRIIIRILVNRGTPMTRSTFGSLSFQGVTGIAFVQLDDSGADPELLPTSLKDVAQLPLHPGLLEQLQTRGDALLKELDVVIRHVDKLTDEQARSQLLATASSIQQAADAATPALKQLPQTLAKFDQTADAATRLLALYQRPDGPLASNLNRVGAAATDLDAAAQQIVTRVTDDTLPRINALSEDVRTTTRSFDRAATVLSTNPRGALFGLPAAPPGPGEPGFVWPSATSSDRP
jgi:phospholipid/cholesterol/gamma-HCH transport system substrate-binding protein